MNRLWSWSHLKLRGFFVLSVAVLRKKKMKKNNEFWHLFYQWVAFPLTGCDHFSNKTENIQRVSIELPCTSMLSFLFFNRLVVRSETVGYRYTHGYEWMNAEKRNEWMNVRIPSELSRPVERVSLIAFNFVYCNVQANATRIWYGWMTNWPCTDLRISPNNCNFIVHTNIKNDLNSFLLWFLGDTRTDHFYLWIPYAIK